MILHARKSGLLSLSWSAWPWPDIASAPHPLDVLLLGHPHWDDDDRNFTATLYVPGFAAVVRETVEPCQTRNRLIGYFSHASPFIHPNH